jgi:pyruvate-formate lyase-activating enzyme
MGTVRYKFIEHERTQDAPFVGALISAIGCSHNCPGCFNQHLKQEEILYSTAGDIIKKVQQNPFNQGIILGGLEWTEQRDEMLDLVAWAKTTGLQVMIYTHMTLDELKREVPELFGRDIWCKFGEYDQNNLSDTNVQKGVHLASANQYVNNEY